MNSDASPNGALRKGPLFHGSRSSRETLIRKILVSVKFLSAILGPEMAAPILWTPRISVFFLQKNLHVHKSRRFRGGGVFGVFFGGGEVPSLSIFLRQKFRIQAVKWAVAKLQGDETASFCREICVAKLQGNKSASQSSMELYDPWSMDFRTPPCS